MRKTVVIAILAMVLVCSRIAYAFQNEPEGFRGIKWGDPPTVAMKFLRKWEDLIIYNKPSDERKLGDAKFSMILYAFYVPPNSTVKRLATVSLYFNGKENFDILETICKIKFGEPTEEGFYKFNWISLASTVILTYDNIEESGFLGIGSTPIFNQYTEEKEKRQAEEAEKDW